MRFDVVPTEKVNDIPFGALREEVRNALGGYEEFRKDISDKNTADDHGFCHCFYDDDDRFIAIEIFNENTVYIGDISVFPNDTDIIMGMADDFTELYGTAVSLSMSVGLDAECDDDELPESILFARKGYYDELISEEDI